MRISKNGLDLIKVYEKCRLKAFKPTTRDVWTIGWGHTKGVQKGDICTQEQADAWLVEDTASEELRINLLVTKPLTQNQFDALVSLVYNIGGTKFSSSTLLKRLNAGQYEEAADEFQKWDKQEGKVLNGLVARRADERELFLTGVDI